MHKQVIVMRKFKSLRTGKYIAQGAHASLGASHFSSQEDRRLWGDTGCTKIVVYVKTERELIDLQDACKADNIPCYLVIDAGRTEFDVPTITALGIGPCDGERINKVTGKLPLF